MPVNPVRRAPAAQAIAVPAVLAAMVGLDGLDQIGSEPGQLEMIPVYSISARNIVSGRWNRGWRSGWRYFWTHPSLDTGITVEVRRGAGSLPVLTSISIGSAAVVLHQALAHETEKLARRRERYRPRILRLPWIGMEAIWLNTDPLSVPDRFVNRAGRPNGEAFKALAVDRASAFLAFYRNRRRALDRRKAAE